MEGSKRATRSVHGAGTRRRALRLVSSGFLAAVLLTVGVYGGCTLDPLQPECYRCPCGDSGLVCEQGFCILKQRRETLNPNQITQFIASCTKRPETVGENPLPPPKDGGGGDTGPSDKIDYCSQVTCTGGFVCDPRDGSCIQSTKCPNNEPPLPDGTCPKKAEGPDTSDPCANVTCVPGKVCDSATGDCFDANCRQHPTLCKGAQCCHATTGICTSDCRQCSGCIGGFKCNQASGVCEDDTPAPTCQGTAICAHSGDCCNNNCISGVVISDSISSCECKADKDCKSGKCSAVILSQPTNVKLVCSCNSDADCGSGKSCKSFLGTKLCAH